MRKAPNRRVEKYRLTHGEMASTQQYGNNGAFIIPRIDSFYYQVIASDGAGWEHVSATIRSAIDDKYYQVLSWAQMCEIKKMFWYDDECVVQFHPAEAEYGNSQPTTVLHLWKPTDQKMPTPPKMLMGPKGIKP